MSSLWGRAACLLALTTMGCVPHTFSHEAAIDFDEYSSVGVEVSLVGAASGYDAPSASSYLAGELSESSGFSSVTTEPSDQVDLILSVQIGLTEFIDYTDSGPEYSYPADAHFRTVDLAGHLIDDGTVSALSDYPSEAVEDALDEVALHYIEPYRL